MMTEFFDMNNFYFYLSLNVLGLGIAYYLKREPLQALVLGLGLMVPAILCMAALIYFGYSSFGSKYFLWKITGGLVGMFALYYPHHLADFFIYCLCRYLPRVKDIRMSLLYMLPITVLGYLWTYRVINYDKSF